MLDVEKNAINDRAELRQADVRAKPIRDFAPRERRMEVKAVEFLSDDLSFSPVTISGLSRRLRKSVGRISGPEHSVFFWEWNCRDWRESRGRKKHVKEVKRFETALMAFSL
jgi:hypothetical protein